MLILKANVTQGFNTMSVLRLSVWEGTSEVKGAVDYSCGSVKFWKGDANVIKNRFSFVSVSTVETMIQGHI